jgi:hypothetical protein
MPYNQNNPKKLDVTTLDLSESKGQNRRHSQVLAMILAAKTREDSIEDDLPPAPCTLYRSFSVIPTDDAVVTAVYLTASGDLLVNKGQIDATNNRGLVNLGANPLSDLPVSMAGRQSFVRNLTEASHTFFCRGEMKRSTPLYPVLIKLVSEYSFSHAFQNDNSHDTPDESPKMKK